MENIKVQVRVTPEACQQMVRYSKYSKIIYWLSMILLALMQIWFHVNTRLDNSIAYDNPEKLAAANNVDLLFTSISILILLLAFHYIWKHICLRVLGGKLYNAYKKKNLLDVDVDFHLVSCKFSFKHSDLNLRGTPKIYSTKNYYLFYYTINYLREVSFFLPKHGDDEFKSKVEKIIGLCTTNQKVSVKDKS